MMGDSWTPAPEHDDCQGSIHPKALEGFSFFNRGEYWLAHEALEAAWLEEQGQIRHLYRGILQIGVAYYHIQHKNYPGAVKVFMRSKRWLNPFPDICRGIDLKRLRNDADSARLEVLRLGPERLDEFDLSLLRPLVWDTNES